MTSNMEDVVLLPNVEGAQSINNLLSASNTTGEPASKRKKRSKIYDHFTWNEKLKMWKCKFCRDGYHDHEHLTGTLNNHIRRKHPSVKCEADDSSSKLQIQTKLSFSKSSPPNTKLKEDTFREKLIRHIICSDQPFCLVEEKEFRELIQYCTKGDPAANMPSAKLTRTMISNMYEQKKTDLMETLQRNTSKISFAIDCWTSSNQYPFQGVTATWIDQNWKLCNIVIDLTILKGSHTGHNIAAAFSDVLKEFGLWNKLLALTTDNASNMDTAFDAIENFAQENDSMFTHRDCRVRCLAHIINLVCKAIIKSVGDEDRVALSDDDIELYSTSTVIGKLRKAVVAIRGSPQRREKFERQCAAANTIHKNLVRDVSTRWNSTLLMIERAYLLKEPLNLTLQCISELKGLILSSDEWVQLKALIELLKPFREATILLSNEHSPTVSRTTSVYQVLFDHLENHMETDPPTRSRPHQLLENDTNPVWLTKAAEAGWEKLKKYYPTVDGLVYQVCTVLDPRYKLEWYSVVKWKQPWVRICKKGVTELWEQQYKPAQVQVTAEASTGENRSSKPSSTFESIFQKQMTSMQKSSQDDELKRYLSQAVVSQDLLNKEISGINGALGWWKLHEAEFPNLSKMARDYLGVSGTGVPVERLFSTGSDLLSHRRQSLSANTIKEVLCLKNWLKHEEDSAGFETKMRDALQYKILGDFLDF